MTNKFFSAVFLSASLCSFGYVEAQVAPKEITQQDISSGKVNINNHFTVVSGVNMTNFYATRALPNGVTRNEKGEVWMQVETEKNIVGADLRVHLSDLKKLHRDVISITQE